MDPLTHTATGWFLSRAGLRRFTPQATWVLLLAANSPDVDIVTAARGSLSYLNGHRHLTHALAAWPVMALLPVLLVGGISRRPIRWRAAYLLSLAGVGSHLALDSTNIYGVRLLLPFSARWFHLDITSVVDLWIWAVLLIALVGPLLARLVSQEIGAPAARGIPGRGFAWFALAFVALYDGGRVILHQRAVETLEARLYGGATPRRVAALPDPFNPFRWRGLVETSGFYAVAACNLLGEFDPEEADVLYKPEAQPALAAAARSPAIRDFLRFARWPYWQVLPAPEPEGAWWVEVTDLRFGSPRQPSFVARALVSNRLEVLESSFRFGNARPR